MNRKIKYRVWDNENKSYNDPYSYAYYALTQDGGLDFYCHGDHMSEADPDVYFIEQYTGLKDKNGKEIYEGDIVRYGNDNAAIVWREKNAEFGVKWLDCGVEDSISWQIGTEKTHSEVIGNIHENPELLEEEK